MAAYVVFSVAPLLWHDVTMALMFFSIALMNAGNLYGSVRALRELEKSS